MQNISIIIPSKDRIEIIKQCLNHISENMIGFDIQVIVVNDSKTLNLKESLIDYDFVEVVDNPKSGVASARNLGAFYAKGDWLLFLDDDMLLNKGCFETYLKYTEFKDYFTSNIDWVYPPEIINKIKTTSFGRFLIKYGFTSLQGWNNFIDYPSSSTILVEGITSQNLFISKNNFIFSGGYNETFPMAGFEDYAFSAELRNKKFKMYIDTRAQMFHNEADRQTPSEWYRRKERGAFTRRVAVEQGYVELELHYSYLKHFFYYFYNVSKLIVNILIFFTNKSKYLDPISFSCYKYLLGLTIYKGYNSTHK